jgi:hypothetical protein
MYNCLYTQWVVIDWSISQYGDDYIPTKRVFRVLYVFSCIDVRLLLIIFVVNLICVCVYIYIYRIYIIYIGLYIYIYIYIYICI